jgi:hypothetical protein
LVEVQAEALGDLLELPILLDQRLELTPTLGHPLLGAAELIKNGHASPPTVGQGLPPSNSI